MQPLGMWLTTLALGAMLPVVAAQEAAKDLGAVLESRKDLSTFNSLIRVRSSHVECCAKHIADCITGLSRNPA